MKKSNISISFILLFFIVFLIIFLITIFWKNIKEGFETKIEMYVISLKHEDRLQNIKKQEDKIGEKIQIFDAVKGDLLNTDQLFKDGIIDSKYATKDKEKKREVGCYMSHLNLIQKLNNTNYSIIFEDDFDIVDNTFMKTVNTIITNLEKNNIDFDIIFLGNLNTNHSERLIENENIYRIDKNNNLWGTHGYLVNNSKIDKIIDKINFIDMAIDNKYETLGKNGELIIFVIYPTIVDQQPDKIKSTIKDLTIETFI